MRAVPICLFALLLTTPGLACGPAIDIADDARSDLRMVDDALARNAVPENIRVELAARRAEADRLLRDGANLRSQTADQNREPALSGIARQSEALRIIQGVMKDLGLSIPVAPAALDLHC